MMVETPKGLTHSSSTNPNYVHTTSSPNLINANHFFLNFDQPIINSSSSDHLSFWKSTSSSSSKPDMIAGAGDFCHQEEDHLLQRSSHQGLSLSLSNSTNPGITIQSFDNHQQQLLQTHHSGKSTMYMHDDDYEFLIRKQAAGNTTASSAGVVKYQTAPSNFLTSSIYLLPAQHLLNEFCNLGTSNQNKKHSVTKAFQITNQFQHQDHNSSSNFSSKTVPLNSTEFMELQKRKSRLLQMLDEVDRKYHNYCDQMKAVVSSFEAVAGNGAATVYSALASKAMSRHFRCLRDGIVGQIKATKMAMGEKDNSAPGATKGETPRLRLLDQTLRQQRAFQQMITMDCHPWRPQRGLPERSVSVLRAWLFEHFLHPYPSDVDKHILARQTGLSRSQVSNWFINARVRLWKPMVEEMYVEETKDNNGDDEMNIQSVNISDKFNAVVDDDENMITRIPKIEQKPTVESADHCLSSFINTLEQHQRLSADSFGTVDIDFSSYNHNSFDIVNGGRVSLNLGLQQHGSGGGDGGEVTLYYPRDRLDEDCQTAVVEYSSVLEGDDQGQNLPYRNLTGAQLLHDLAG